jgi:hypothetical protein
MFSGLDSPKLYPMEATSSQAYPASHRHCTEEVKVRVTEGIGAISDDLMQRVFQNLWG